MALAWALLDLLTILGLGPYYTSPRLIFSTLHQGAAAVQPMATCAVTTFTAKVSHAGPATWNALPDNIRTVADPVKFRKLLKSLF